MKTTTIKTKVMSILLATVMLVGLLPTHVFAADTAPAYVALGDSISTGYGLADKTAQGFTYLLADALDYELTNLAVDGNTAAGILAQLQEQSVKDAVAGADLITITAGGNDLMALLYQAIAAEYNKLPIAANAPITADEVITIISDSADTRRLTVMSTALGLLKEDADIYLLDDEAFTDAIADYISTLNQVLSAIKALNEDAAIIVTTQYNPYIEFNGASFDAFLAQVDLTPIYGGMEEGVTALNTAIKGNASSGGYTVADVKAAFDAQSDDLYVADPAALNFDFHPNAAGHAIIASTIEQNTYHYDPIVVGDRLLKHGDKYELDADSYAVYEGVGGKAVLRLVNFDYTVDDLSDVASLPEKGYESMNSYTSHRDAVIYTHLDALEIVLEGTNSFTCNVGNLTLLRSDGELTIASAANGKLSLSAEAINVRGIYADTVTVKNCELNVSTTAACIIARLDFYRFIGCGVTLVTSSQSSPAIPYLDADVELSGCIGVAGADNVNTEPIERLKSDYKYIKIFVPSSLLDAPENLKISGTQVSWDAVEGAFGYEVEYYETNADNTELYKLGTVKVSSTVTSYDFEDIAIFRDWQYFFRVRTMGDNASVGNSEWAQSERYVYADLFIAGKEITNKQYLYNDGTISTAAPTDPAMGYAYYEKGEPDTLTLSNFKLAENPQGIGHLISIICAGALDVRLIGDNILASEEDPAYISFAVDGPPPPPSMSGMLLPTVIKITGEEGSTLTAYAEEFAHASFLNIVVDEPVTVNTTGEINSDYLEVYGNLYADCGIFLYGPLTRGENGYISAKVSEDAEWGALEFYSYDDPETSEYSIDDYLALNGGVIVDGNGDTLAGGHYMLIYEDTYSDYWYAFYDPDIDASEHSGENASKQVVICSESALTAQVTVDVEVDDSWGSVTGAGEYDEGSSVTLIATPAEDTEFQYWIDATADLGDYTEAELRAAIVSYDATYTFTATEDIRLRAVFSGTPQIGITPMLITGTDAESLYAAEWWDVERDFGFVTPGAEQIELPGDVIEDLVTVGDKQYKFKGFIVFGYDETTDTETVELKQTMTIGAMPLYDSAEYWELLTPISDGLNAAYMEYTPEADDDEPQDPGTPAGPGASEPGPDAPEEPPKPTDPAQPDDSQTSSSPQTGDSRNIGLWIALLFINGGAIITLTAADRKKREAKHQINT